MRSGEIFYSAVGDLALPASIGLYGASVFGAGCSYGVVASGASVDDSIVASVKTVMSYCKGAGYATSGGGHKVVGAFSGKYSCMSGGKISAMSINGALCCMGGLRKGTLCVGNRPVVGCCSPLIFPSSRFSTSVTRMGTGVGRDLTFVHQSSRLLRDMSMKGSAAGMMVAAVVVIVIMIVLVLVTMKLLFCYGAEDAPVVLKGSRLDNVGGLSFDG